MLVEEIHSKAMLSGTSLGVYDVVSCHTSAAPWHTAHLVLEVVVIDSHLFGGLLEDDLITVAS